MDKRIGSVAMSFVVIVLCRAADVRAQMNGGAPDVQDKLNPLASEMNLPATLTVGFERGLENTLVLDFQPRIPVPLTADWRLVARTGISVVQVPAPTEPMGLSDAVISLFLTPRQTGAWIWGAGPILQVPTATREIFGTGKFSIGPTAALVYVSGPWVNGVVASHLSSVAGSSNRGDVNLTQAEVQFSYSFPSGLYVQTAPTISYDWTVPAGQRWVVPAGADVGRGVSVGSQQVSLQIGAYYSVLRPQGSPSWSLSVQAAWVH